MTTSMLERLRQALGDRNADIRGRIVAILGFLIAANLGAWGWALVAFRDYLVVLASAAIAAAAAALEARFAAVKAVGTLVGTSVSALFLFAIALANLVVLRAVYRSFARGEARRPLCRGGPRRAPGAAWPARAAVPAPFRPHRRELAHVPAGLPVRARLRHGDRDRRPRHRCRRGLQGVADLVDPGLSGAVHRGHVAGRHRRRYSHAGRLWLGLHEAVAQALLQLDHHLRVGPGRRRDRQRRGARPPRRKVQPRRAVLARRGRAQRAFRRARRRRHRLLRRELGGFLCRLPAQALRRDRGGFELEAIEHVDPGGELAPVLDDRAARRIAQHVFPRALGLEPPALAVFVDGGDTPSGAIEATMRGERVELRACGLRRADAEIGLHVLAIGEGDGGAGEDVQILGGRHRHVQAEIADDAVMPADAFADIESVNEGKQEILGEQLRLGRRVDIAQARQAVLRVVVAAKVVADGDAGAVCWAADHVDADTLAVREEGDVLVADVEDDRWQRAISLRSLVNRLDLGAAAQRDAPVRQRTGERRRRLRRERHRSQGRRRQQPGAKKQPSR